MPLDREQYTSTNPTSFPSISVDNGILVGDTLSTQNITGKILYSGAGTTYIPVGISTVVANSVSYSPTAPTNPSVGQMWVDSSSNNTSFDPNLIRRKTIVATGGQTAFTADLAFTDGYEQVFLNGLLLTRNTDYTTVNSIQVNLVVAAVVNDVIDILSITNLNSVGAAGALTTSNTFTGSQTFTPSSAAITPITVNGAFNQTADLLQINNYSASNLLKIDSSGKLGLGVSSMSYPLHVASTSLTNVGYEIAAFQQNAATYQGLIRVLNSGGSSVEFGIDATTSQAVIRTTNTVRLTIDPTGNIGIGTSSPNKKLTVSGEYNFGPQRSWNLGQPTISGITSAGANCYIIKVNMAANYFKGFTWDVHMNGGKDWGGHGLMTYFGKMSVVFSSNTSATVRMLEEYSASALDSTGFFLYNSSSVTNDGTYLYITINYKCTLSASDGHKPIMNVITYDPATGTDTSNTGSSSQINSVYAV